MADLTISIVKLLPPPTPASDVADKPLRTNIASPLLSIRISCNVKNNFKFSPIDLFIVLINQSVSAICANLTYKLNKM